MRIMYIAYCIVVSKIHCMVLVRDVLQPMALFREVRAIRNIHDIGNRKNKRNTVETCI